MTREFVYMPSFEKQWANAKLTDKHLRELEVFLCEHPKAGDIIEQIKLNLKKQEDNNGR